MTLAIVLTAVLLALAVAVIGQAPWLSKLYLPASVIAGTLGFALVQSAVAVDQSDALLPAVEQWRAWPGVLIAVVFAGMLLVRTPSSSATNTIRRAGREGLMVWIIVLGQTLIGLLVTWLVVQPMTDVPDAFGMLIETGFAGGHGTAAAMGQVFANDHVGLDGGLDLGIMMATAGLVYGILSGVFWVNVGVRRNWVRTDGKETPEHSSVTTEKDISKNTTNAASIGTAVVKPDLIDPLLLQAIWLMLAFAVGWLMQSCVAALAQFVESLFHSSGRGPSTSNQTQVSAILGSFPLFIYTLFGGWIVRRLMTLSRSDHLIDSATIGRITSASMDVLVVAAIASLNLALVSGRLTALVALIIAAAIWTAFCLVYLSRRILPTEHWFELGLINYGMSTGTTATGFVLLKLVDPELESGAAEDYALAAPISSPFVGGGMLTIGIPMIVLGNVSLPLVVATLTIIIMAMIGLGLRLSRQSTSTRKN